MPKPDLREVLARIDGLADTADRVAAAADLRDARREFDRARRDLLIEHGIAGLQLRDAQHAADVIEVDRAASETERWAVAAKINTRKNNNV